MLSIRVHFDGRIRHSLILDGDISRANSRFRNGAQGLGALTSHDAGTLRARPPTARQRRRRASARGRAGLAHGAVGAVRAAAFAASQQGCFSVNLGAYATGWHFGILKRVLD
eukprot:6177343-Pleurochrysis_carterae.AAC.1